MKALFLTVFSVGFLASSNVFSQDNILEKRMDTGNKDNFIVVAPVTGVNNIKDGKMFVSGQCSGDFINRGIKIIVQGVEKTTLCKHDPSLENTGFFTADIQLPNSNAKTYKLKISSLSNGVNYFTNRTYDHLITE